MGEVPKSPGREPSSGRTHLTQLSLSNLARNFSPLECASTGVELVSSTEERESNRCSPDAGRPHDASCDVEPYVKLTESLFINNTALEGPSLGGCRRHVPLVLVQHITWGKAHSGCPRF